ncbi:MAG: BapA prefix-like domain-containing protein, partial [Roseovarius confluentis]
MATSGQMAGDAVNVQISVNKDSVSRFTRSGDDLMVELTNGDTIRVSEFYGGAANGEAHRLIYADGSYSGVEGVMGEEAVAGLGEGFGMNGLGAGLAAGAGIGGIALASHLDDSDGGVAL